MLYTHTIIAARCVLTAVYQLTRESQKGCLKEWSYHRPMIETHTQALSERSRSCGYLVYTSRLVISMLEVHGYGLELWASVVAVQCEPRVVNDVRYGDTIFGAKP
jgi:hypothetical protein